MSAAASTEPRTAFVLSGGGSLGAIQAGMLIELLDSGVVPDLVVGVSAGAINGAFIAFDPTPRTAAAMAELWMRVRTRDVLGARWRLALGLLGLRGHLADAGPLRALLARELPYRALEQTRVPLHVVAADQSTGAEVVISRGDVVDAIVASAAIPGVFPPVARDGRLLVDGAVAAGTPVATACRLGATRVFVLPCGFTCVSAAVPRHAIARAMHAITLIGAQRLRAEHAYWCERAQLRVVPPLCPLTRSSYDYSGARDMVGAARASTRRWLAAGGLDSAEFPHELEEHSHP